MALVPLLHLCDSLFPIGAFGHSDGLEAAAAHMRTPDDLREWLDICVDQTIGRAEGPAMLQAWTAFSLRDWPALGALDEETTALRPSSSARQSSRALGLRLVITWQALYPDPDLQEVVDRARRRTLGPALPIAFACACASAGVEARDAAVAFAYTRLAATISAAMRVMPIGQTDAHEQLAGALKRVPAMIEQIARRPCIESFAPAMDIAQMTQQFLHSRLFRS